MFAVLSKHFHRNNHLGAEMMVQFGLSVINRRRSNQLAKSNMKTKTKTKFGLDSVVNRRDQSNLANKAGLALGKHCPLPCPHFSPLSPTPKLTVYKPQHTLHQTALSPCYILFLRKCESHIQAGLATLQSKCRNLTTIGFFIHIYRHLYIFLGLLILHSKCQLKSIKLFNFKKIISHFNNMELSERGVVKRVKLCKGEK